MYQLTPELRNNLIAYIQANPSPNVPVGDCVRLLGELQRMEQIRPTVVAEEPAAEGK